MEQRNNGLKGKKIFLIFEDGFNHVGKKTGICIDNNSNEITIECNGIENIIQKSRVIRIEVIKEGQDDNR